MNSDERIYNEQINSDVRIYKEQIHRDDLILAKALMSAYHICWKYSGDFSAIKTVKVKTIFTDIFA